MKAYFLLLLMFVNVDRLNRFVVDAQWILYDNSPQCFRFTWLGVASDDMKSSTNCSAIPNAPCIKPLYYSPKSPNVTEIWRNNNRSESICQLQPGHICVKYTFTYNNAVINISRFCGKMTEDTKTALSSGCYSQQVDGYTVEACACVTLNGRFPCNSSSMNNASLKLLFFAMIIILCFHKYVI